MVKFVAKTICILGRQPQLGMAELESLYGPDHTEPLDGAALLDVAAEDINFRRLGGTVKVAQILTEIDSTDWKTLSRYLLETVPDHLKNLAEGKFTLGLSLYGINSTTGKVQATLLEIKKKVRQTGRPVRIVPNKALGLSSAQVLHNKLIHKGAWELMFVKSGDKTLLAQTLFVQDIEAYAARDQARPARDSRVGMLPPKLAQIIINLAAGRPETRMDENWDKGDSLGRFLVLDPFCGTGVILQEALLMGYSVYGSDVDPRMVEYTKRNLQWLVEQQPSIQGRVVVEPADATNFTWPGFSTIASEVFLGRPLNSLPPETALKQIISDANVITKKFLKNLSPQLKAGRTICLAVPAWRHPGGKIIDLPVIDQITDMGYNYSDLRHVGRDQLVYFRQDQVVARRILRLEKA